MRYLGGKSKTGREIAGYLNRLLETGRPYWEPFCGACWVTQYVVAERRYASDVVGMLIAMWQALQDGWLPPRRVSENEYAMARHGHYPPHLTAFILYGCSFGGKAGAGYARGENRNWALEARASIREKMRRLGDVTFFAADFLTTEPPEPDCVIYCDPPYAGTTSYKAAGMFDTAAFWQRCRDLEAAGHTVVVSEYSAPSDFSCVHEMVTKTDLHTTNGKDTRIERLFRPGQHQPLQPKLF